MPEQAIIRTQVIVVGEVGTNTYGDLTFTDKEGGAYKVSAKRKPYFDKVIVPGMAVQLSYAMSSFGKEYVYGAVQVKDNLPPPTTPPPMTHPDAPAIPKPEIKGVPLNLEHGMGKSDWAEKDRITRKSIERQTSLNAAIELGKALGIAPLTSSQVIATAKLFEAYLEGKEVQPASKLIEAAKKLGAEEIPKEGE